MLLIIFALVAAAFFIYRYYEEQRSFWTARGIDGPPAEFLWGNLRDLVRYDYPKALRLRDWAKVYGKVYGMHEGQRKFLVVSDLKMAEEILAKQFDNFNARAKFPLQASRQSQKTNIVEAWGSHWKRLRALGSPAFSNNALKQILPTIDESARAMADILEEESTTGDVNMLEFFQEYTMDIICKLALGKKDVKMFANPYVEVAKEVFSMPLNSPIHVVPCLFPFTADAWRALLQKAGEFFGVSYAKLLRDLEAYVAQRKKERAAGITCDSNDMIDMFLDAEVDAADISYDEDSTTKQPFYVADLGRSLIFQISRQLGFDEVVSQSAIFLLAGFETTANSLAYVAHLLATHPHVQARLRDEIDAVAGGDEEKITFEQLAELRYTECVIKESLRHYPLASFVCNRECVKDTQVCGMTIEKGTWIHIDTWTIHMDESIWGEDAAEFRPERWEDGSLTAPRVAFQAFGEGPRMCVGMRLALAEEKMALAHLIRRFVFTPCEKTNPLKLVGSFTVTPDHVTVSVQRR